MYFSTTGGSSHWSYKSLIVNDQFDFANGEISELEKLKSPFIIQNVKGTFNLIYSCIDDFLGKREYNEGYSLI